MAVYAGETLVNAIRHWLRIPYLVLFLF